MLAKTPETADILDTFGAAEFLKISERTLRQLAGEQKIPHCRVGNQFRFSKRQLLEHIEGAPRTTAVRRAESRSRGQIFKKTT